MFNKGNVPAFRVNSVIYIDCGNFRITLVQYTVNKQQRKQNAFWPKESDNGSNMHT